MKEQGTGYEYQKKSKRMGISAFKKRFSSNLGGVLKHAI